MQTKDTLKTNCDSKCSDAEQDRLFYAEEANAEANDSSFADQITWRAALPQVSTFNFPPKDGLDLILTNEKKNSSNMNQFYR